MFILCSFPSLLSLSLNHVEWPSSVFHTTLLSCIRFSEALDWDSFIHSFIHWPHSPETLDTMQEYTLDRTPVHHMAPCTHIPAHSHQGNLTSLTEITYFYTLHTVYVIFYILNCLLIWKAFSLLLPFSLNAMSHLIFYCMPTMT